MKYLKPIPVIFAMCLILALAAFVEFVLPNYVSRLAGKIARETGLSAAVQAHQIDGSQWQANEFLFEFVKLENLKTQRVAGLIRGESESDFSVVEQTARKFADYDFGAFLDANKLETPKDNAAGLKRIISIDGSLFALVGLQHETCKFGAIIALEAMQIVDRFPCLPGPEDRVHFNGLGGGHVIKDGMLYLAVGAAGDEPHDATSPLAQDAASPYGKILRYAISTDAAGTRLTDRHIFTSGHRNPQGMIFYGDIPIAVEHGPKGGDEINIITSGKNYGWPRYSLGSGYDDRDIPSFSGNEAENTAPLFAFTPSIGISDISACPSIIANRYKGADCMIVSSLIGQSLYIVLADLENKRVISTEKVEVGARIRQAFVQEDILYLVTDFVGVYRVEIEAF